MTSLVNAPISFETDDLEQWLPGIQESSRY